MNKKIWNKKKSNIKIKKKKKDRKWNSKIR